MKTSNNAKDGQGGSLEGAALEVAVDKYIAKHRLMRTVTRLYCGNPGKNGEPPAGSEAMEEAIEQLLEKGESEKALTRMDALCSRYALYSQTERERAVVRRMWQTSPEYCAERMSEAGMMNAVIYTVALLLLAIVGGIVWLCC